MANASKLRSKITGSKARPGRAVTLEIDGEKIEIELRQPNVAMKSHIALASGLQVEDGRTTAAPHMGKFAAHIVLECAYEGGAKAFDASDLDALISAGPEFDALFEAALELVKPEETDLGK
jgi:hypothetical protein